LINAVLPAHARNWQALYAFGDSFSDTGAGFVNGNGPTAVAYLAASPNIPFTYAGDPNSDGKSLNFAVSGAPTGADEGEYMRPGNAECGVDEGLLGRGMQTQVLDFSRRVKLAGLRFDPERTLFFLAGGLNDVGLPTTTTVANLEGEVSALYALGGRYFMIALLPTKISALAFAKTSTRLNPAIAKIPRDLRSNLPHIHIELSHWGRYFDEVMQTPPAHGISNTTDICAGRAIFGEDTTPCTAPGAHFYYHEGHPSTAVHRIVGLKLKREVNHAFPE
jgi:phospholipase/lecithinase/hemolysin